MRAGVEASMKTSCVCAVVVVAVLSTTALAAPPAQTASNPGARSHITWRPLQDGVAYTALTFVDRPTYGDGVLHVVKIDPSHAPIAAFGSSIEHVGSQTAADWATQQDLAVVINAGMYAEDHRTHTGYFRVEGHTNSDTWVSAYKSVLVVPRGAPAGTQIVDLDATAKSDFADDGVVVQNLRLIRAPGVNVWAENQRAWSEAAVAMTSTGEILFVFSRSPLSMRAFNTRLLATGLDVVRAMHVEGGPEASLSIHAGGIDLDLAGSYETGFVESDDNHRQWRVPNVLGVRRSK